MASAGLTAVEPQQSSGFVCEGSVIGRVRDVVIGRACLQPATLAAGAFWAQKVRQAPLRVRVSRYRITNFFARYACMQIGSAAVSEAWADASKRYSKGHRCTCAISRIVVRTLLLGSYLAWYTACRKLFVGSQHGQGFQVIMTRLESTDAKTRQSTAPQAAMCCALNASSDSGAEHFPNRQAGRRASVLVLLTSLWFISALTLLHDSMPRT
jgi:hypothetical protein